MVTHIVKLMILATDPRWIGLLLLSSARDKSLYIDTLLLPADKPIWIYFFGGFPGMNKASVFFRFLAIQSV
jgi:hypothetical protein